MTQITRRMFMTGGLKVGLTTLLVGRMFYLQVFRGDYYRLLSRENSVKIKWLPPKRGEIFDCFGRSLAKNEDMYAVVCEKGDFDKVSALIENNPRLNFLKTEEQWAHVKQMLSQGMLQTSPLTLREGLTWAEVSYLESQNIPEITVTATERRIYPYHHYATHVIGYVQSPGPDDQKQDAFYALPGIKKGKTGIEKAFETPLKGVPGYREIEVDARKTEVREFKTQPSQIGESLDLSLDITVQKFVIDRLRQEKSASAVLMNVTGEIIAMGSVPTYDGSLFVDGISRQNWQDLVQNPYGVLNNKVTQGLYSPGSIFKIVLALAALEEGQSPYETETCTGHMEFGNHRYHCWGWHGRMNLFSALNRSCDIYFYSLARKLGIETINKYARLLGLGEKTGINLPGEKEGLIPTKAWKKNRHGVSWWISDTILSGIGQGYFLSTPLQLAQMMARIASGTAVRPTVRKGSEPFDPLPCKPKNIKTIQRCLHNVINTKGGTGYKSRLQGAGYTMSGKTSSTQVRSISKAQRKQGLHRNLPWKYRDHAMFAGYAGNGKHQVAVSVVVEHGGWGGKVAAPIGRDLLSFVKEKLSTYKTNS